MRKTRRNLGRQPLATNPVTSGLDKDLWTAARLREFFSIMPPAKSIKGKAQLSLGNEEKYKTPRATATTNTQTDALSATGMGDRWRKPAGGPSSGEDAYSEPTYGPWGVFGDRRCWMK